MGDDSSFLGPSYKYQNFIKTPSELGMSDRGTLVQMAKNVAGLVNYTELLIEGKSRASKKNPRGGKGEPLGNKFFLKTKGYCRDEKTDKRVRRYMYINNEPTGAVPFIKQGLGVNFSNFKGLIPGAISSINGLNPVPIFGALSAGGTPACRPLNMETIDENNNKGRATRHVAVSDIKHMDPCDFSNGNNPVSNKRCISTFTGSMADEAKSNIQVTGDKNTYEKKKRIHNEQHPLFKSQFDNSAPFTEIVEVEEKKTKESYHPLQKTAFIIGSISSIYVLYQLYKHSRQFKKT